jgi:DNA-binding NarL/FixJ family response regulator
MRTALRWIINAHAGWQVCGEASNGAEGISAAARLKPDAVVLDFSMPVMNGIEAALQIKKSLPEIHLLMFTSYATHTVEEAARAAGVEAFIDKADHMKFLHALKQLEIEERVGRSA